MSRGCVIVPFVIDKSRHYKEGYVRERAMTISYISHGHCSWTCWHASYTVFITYLWLMIALWHV